MPSSLDVTRDVNLFFLNNNKIYSMLMYVFVTDAYGWVWGGGCGSVQVCDALCAVMQRVESLH